MSEGSRVPARHWDAQPRVPLPGGEVPTISGCENQLRLQLSEKESCGSWRLFLLKGPHAALLADILARSELQCCSSCSEGARDIQGGPELSGFRVRAGGATFSQTEVIQVALEVHRPQLNSACS